MSKLIKAIACVAFASLCGNLFAYNGGYENSIVGSWTNPADGKVYQGYGNKTIGVGGVTVKVSAADAKTMKYAQCSELKSVDLSSVTEIGDAAFAYSALTSVELPSTLKSMGYIAFGGCKNLSSITINSTAFMTSADEAKEPFRDCAALKTVTAKCAPPSWDFAKVFPKVTVKVSPANLSAWQAKKYSGVTVESSVPATKYAIEYVLGGGKAGADAPELVDRDKWPKISAPTRTGYVFAGWKATAGLGSGAYYSVVSGKSVSLTSASTAFGAGYASCTVKNLAAGGKVVTLTATWAAIPATKYAIEYVLGGGKVGADAPELVDRDKWPKISAPTRAGYEFAGWKATAGLGSGACYSVVSGKSVSLTSSSTAFGAGYASCTVKNLAAGGRVVTLTATWKSKLSSTQYAIEYDYAGGKPGASAPEVLDRDKWPKISAPTRAGYEFAGWKATAGLGSGACYSVVSGKSVSLTSSSTAFGAGYASCTVKNLAAAGKVVTLTATWAAIPATKYAIEYVLAGGKAGADAPELVDRNKWPEISAPTRTGYVFAGWKATAGLASGACYSVVSGKSVSLTSASTAFGAGYASCTVKNLAEGGKVVTLTATWKESAIPTTQYAIAYALAGGSTGAKAPTLADRNKWPEISAPTRTGYVFAGWKATAGLGSGACYSVVSGKSVSLTSASTAFGAGYASCTVKNLAEGGKVVTLTATWKESAIPTTQYAITYALAGGSTGAKAPTLADRNKWPEISAPTRTGYVFAGWKATAGLGSGACYSVVSGKSVSLTSASTAFGAGYASCTVKNLAEGGKVVTLTATWTAIPATKYAIEYVLGGGKAGADAPELVDRDKWPKISAPTRTGYVFAGWKATAGLGSGACYSVVSGKSVSLTSSSTAFGAGYASCTVKNLAAGGKVVTLTATWTKASSQCQVSFAQTLVPVSDVESEKTIQPLLPGRYSGLIADQLGYYDLLVEDEGLFGYVSVYVEDMDVIAGECLIVQTASNELFLVMEDNLVFKILTRE